MSQNNNAVIKAFDDILKRIPKKANLLFFPVRLETHFRYKNNKKELCVRIFPDEICLNYKGHMTDEELKAGKFFWMQWYIASGCRKREREAWDVLCDAYPVRRAAWICNALRPQYLTRYQGKSEFMEEGDLFYRRPYPHMEEIEAEVKNIYDSLSKIVFNDEVISVENESQIEKNVRIHIGEVRKSLYTINMRIADYKMVVDYLHDEIVEAITYIKKRLESFKFTYDNNSKLRESRLMELWDSDYVSVINLAEDVERTLEGLANKRISLEKLVQMYYDTKKNEGFFKSEDPQTVSNEFGWTAPTAEILPDRFFFIGELENSNNDYIFEEGKVVDRNLELGLSPQSTIKTNNTDKLTEEEKAHAADPFWIDSKGNLNVNGGLSWMIDYDVAEKKGMAITVPLPNNVNAFKYIYVLGVRSADSCGKLLKDLFEGHNYINGALKLVDAGTPTNLVAGGLMDNTLSDEEIRKRRFEVEVYKAYDTTIEKDSKSKRRLNDASLLSEALHLQYFRPFVKVENYDKCEWLKTRKAYEAMWNFYMKFWNDEINEIKEEIAKRNTIIAGTAPGADKEKTMNEKAFWDERKAALDDLLGELNFIGDFVVNHVRAQGNLPAILLGDVPYGILPITDYKKLKTWIDEKADPKIANLYQDLIELSDLWKKVRKESGVTTYADLKGKDAHKAYLKMAGKTPYSVSFTLRLLFYSSFFSDVKMNGQAMRSEIFKKLDKENYFDAFPTDITWDATTSRDNLPNWIEDDKLVTIGDLRDTLDQIEGEHYSDIEKDRIVAGFLDLFTHRVDAWFEGILHYILCEHRSRHLFHRNEKHRYDLNSGRVVPRTDKLCVGAFGWVFDLKENTRKPLPKSDDIAKVMLLSDNGNNDIYGQTGDDKGEFIVAPSIQQAISVAVLRGAYLRTKKNQGDAHLCVNLSSTRVRQALRIINGIKSGMSTGMVLGADLERYMHEAHRQFGCEMDRYIYPMRKLFPLTVDLEAQDERADNYCMNVINGEGVINTFLKEWDYKVPLIDWLKENGQTLDWVKEMSGIMQPEHLSVLYTLIVRMYDSYDALNDLLLSEGVHRIVMNDDASYRAICNFMSKGKGNLPDPAILDSPMDYVVVSHKVGVSVPTGKWQKQFGKMSYLNNSVMSRTEPSLTQWVEAMAGSMDEIYFYVSYEEGGSYEVCSLADMSVGPLEYLLLYTNKEQFVRYLELCWRIKNQQWAGKVRIELGNPFNNGLGETQSDIMNVYEHTWCMDQIKGLLKYAHPLKASEIKTDLYMDSDDEEFVDVDDLKERYKFVVEKMRFLKSEMERFVSIHTGDGTEPLSDCDVQEAYRFMLQTANMGLTSVLSGYRSDVFIDNVDYITDRLGYEETLKNQQQFLHSVATTTEQLAKRIIDAEAIVKSKDTVLDSQRYVDAIKQLLGNSFKVMKHFKAKYAGMEAINMREAETFCNVDVDKMDDWQSDVAEVRDGMKHWQNLQMFRMSLGEASEKVFIRQSDSNGNDKPDWWLGLAVDSEERLCDVDSLVCYDTIGTDQAKSYMVVDSWLEYIPYKKHDAGIVFHVDTPDNEAPQTLLLAVHPEYMYTDSRTWSYYHLSEVLASTRFLMMNRAVSPESIYGRDWEMPLMFPLLRNGRNSHVRDRVSYANYNHRHDDVTLLGNIVGGPNLNTDE